MSCLFRLVTTSYLITAQMHEYETKLIKERGNQPTNGTRVCNRTYDTLQVPNMLPPTPLHPHPTQEKLS